MRSDVVNEKMKNKANQIYQLRRNAWFSLVGGWVVAIVFLTVAVASMYLRTTSKHYWRAEQVQPFKRDCLSALASSPSVAKRFERFCAHFEIATETAQDYMSFFSLFSVVGAIFGIGNALFAQNVLKHARQDGIHNQKVDHISKGSNTGL